MDIKRHYMLTFITGLSKDKNKKVLTEYRISQNKKKIVTIF